MADIATAPAEARPPLCVYLARAHCNRDGQAMSFGHRNANACGIARRRAWFAGETHHKPAASAALPRCFSAPDRAHLVRWGRDCYRTDTRSVTPITPAGRPFGSQVAPEPTATARPWIRTRAAPASWIAVQRGCACVAGQSATTTGSPTHSNAAPLAYTREVPGIALAVPPWAHRSVEASVATGMPIRRSPVRHRLWKRPGRAG